MALTLKELELHSVAEGLRQTAIVNINPTEIYKLQGKIKKMGLVAIPSGVFAREEGYSNESRPPNEGEAVDLRCFVTRPQFARECLDWDDSEIGNHLGYPRCCIRHFCENWIERGCKDLTWSSYLKTNFDKFTEMSTVFLRFLGVRPVFHLPCSFSCEQTVHLANVLGSLAEDLGHESYFRLLCDLTIRPVRWSALHGIAIIEHDFFKIVYDSDFTDSELGFSLAGPIRPETWFDNGFASWQSLEAAHNSVLEILRPLMPFSSVIDLGAGDGLLLDKIQRVFRVTGFGVECDGGKVSRGNNLFPKVELIKGEIATYFHRADVVLISEQRLFEGEDIDRIRSMVNKYLVVYSYSNQGSLELSEHVDKVFYRVEKHVPATSRTA